MALTGFASLSAPAGASAAVGDLSFVRCASNDGSAGSCADLPGSAFDEPSPLAVSPSGQLLLAARGSRTVNRLTGELGFVSCAANVATGGLCADLATPLFVPPSDVVLTPDGGTLYVSGASNDAVSRFSVDPSGTLAYQGCVSDDGSGGACTNVPGTAFDGPSALAVTPDGDSLYVASGSSSSISHFSIGAGGALAFVACASDSGSGGACADVPGSVFVTPAGLAVSPDGSALYASASLSDTVTRFALAPAGGMTYSGCVSSVAAGTCTDLPGSPLLEPRAIDVSPDGTSVHVAAISSDSLVDLSVTPAGELFFAGCSSQSGSAGACADLPDVLDIPASLDVSPDGRSLYVVASGSDSLSRFDLASAGAATFAGCLSDTGSAGLCADLPGAAFDRPVDLAVAPSGSSLYVTAADSDSVSQLAREIPDTDPPGLTLKVKKRAKAGKPVAVTVACDEACAAVLTATVKLKGGGTGKLNGRSAQLAAGEPVKLKLKPKRRLKRRLVRAGRAKARIFATATDAGGNAADAFAKQKLR